MKLIDNIKIALKGAFSKTKSFFIKLPKQVWAFAKRHPVSMIMTGLAAGFTAFFPLIDPANKPHLFFWLVVAFMLRGMFWEDAYIKRIDFLETYTAKTSKKK